MTNDKDNEKKKQNVAEIIESLMAILTKGVDGVATKDPDDPSVSYIMKSGMDIQINPTTYFGINKFNGSKDFQLFTASNGKEVMFSLTMSQVEKLSDFLISKLHSDTSAT